MKKSKRFLFVTMVAVMAMAIPSMAAMAGEGSSSAEFNDPAEYYAAKQREAAASTGFSDPAEYYAAKQREAAASAGFSSAQFNDPSEYYAAMDREAAAAAANVAFPSFAGSYSDLRLTASDGEPVVFGEPFPSFAGSYGDLRLGASGAGATAESGSCEVC